jgi:predicted nuclease of predicted toxin-antitoxin system
MTGSRLKLYLDEHIWRELSQRLRDKGYDAVHVYEVDRGGESDESQLDYAAREGRAILTYDAGDFVPIAELWFEAGRDHAGIVLSNEIGPGELLRRVLKLLETVSAEEMRNAVRYLQEFK